MHSREMSIIPGSDGGLVNAVFCLVSGVDMLPNESKFEGHFKLILQVAKMDDSGYPWQ